MSSAGSRRNEIVLLFLLTLIAFSFRIYGVGTLSLAEDEAAKWQAIARYQQGHFAGVNSEHPMLLKLLAWAGLGLGRFWNHHAAARNLPTMRDEIWMRLPNITLGAATTIVLYLLGRQMLSMIGAGFAAFFWAISPLSVAFNRFVKEETPFVFFTLLAFYFYFRGKNATSDREAGRFFILSGASFGLDLASAYLAIGQFGLIVLVWHIANRVGIKSRQMGPHFLPLVVTMAVVFLVFNPVALSLSNLLAMTNYSAEKTLQHRGYLLDGQLHLNNALTTPYGLPWYFYFWVFAIKTPLPILAACLAGVALLFLEPDRLVSIFVRVILIFWVVPYSLAGSKWIRYVLLILPALYLAAGWAIERLVDWMNRRSPAPRRAGFAVAGLLLIAVPLAESLRWAPYDQLYLNTLGGGYANAGRFFPPDEVYDLGVRQAVEYVCQVAPPGAVLAGSAPMGLQYYVQDFARRDLRVVPLFDPNYVPKKGDFLVIQDSRRYFETDGLIDLLERRGPPEKEISLGGLTTAQVYRF